MSFISQLLDANSAVIVFAYGLVFFIMGLAVALQSRRYSRLDLARSLSWLAAFGILHGLHEWGDFFIPLQSSYLSPTVLNILIAIHLILLAISYVCLFQFGVMLLQPQERMTWLNGSAFVLFVIWLCVAGLIVLPVTSDIVTWQHAMNALARYFIGFPGSLLAAYGLRRQALQRIAPLGVPHIVASLRLAGVVIAIYAVLGGLIPPSAPFFPANWLNVISFQQVVGVPPLLFRSLLGLLLAITIIRTLEVFDVETERIIEAMEQQQILAAERDRIGRELHDGAIQTVYTAGLLVESAYKQSEPGSAAAERLERALSVLNSAIGDLRRNLGELRPASSSVPLPQALHRMAEDPRYSSFVAIAVDVDLPPEDELSAIRVEHVLAVAGEALSNVVRHAHARRVRISARCVEKRLLVTIHDDGMGAPHDPHMGYGLRNMRDRARLLGGQLEIKGVNGKGTTVTLDVPWRDDR